MYGVLIEDLVIVFQIELAAQTCLPAAGVHDDLGGDINLLPGNFRPYSDRLTVHKVDLFYMHALMNLRAQAFRMLEQQQVKFASIHMIGMIAVDAFLSKFGEV